MFIRSLLAASLASFSMVSFAASTGQTFPQARANNLSVNISIADRVTRGDQDVAVDVVLTNNGDAPISVVKWFVPDGEPEGDLFLLTRNGEAVSYVGPIIKRPAPTVHDMITLQPGESISRTAELSGLYDLSESGAYTIQYGAASAHVLGRSLNKRSTNSAERFNGSYSSEVVVNENDGVTTLFSNEASTFIAGRQDKARAEAIAAQKVGTITGALAQSISFSGRCSATQQSTLISAAAAAQNMANDSVNYLNGTPRASSRYTTWFGSYSLANWNEVKGHYVNIKDQLDNKPVTYDCSCKKSYYAYVYPNQPYKIYLCRAFWTAPLTGTDSKGGTIIHESSHFTVNAGTQDYAYGQTAAKSLAISNPSQARLNADSHEYFAENTPAQP